MNRYLINEFRVESGVRLPCEREWGVGSDDVTFAPLSVVRAHPGALEQFSSVEWIGRRGGSALRAYHAGGGIMVCVDDCLRLHVDGAGSEITLDFDSGDARALWFAAACTVNLGVSICTLLRGQLPLHGAAVDLEDRRVALVAPSGTGKSTLLWRLVDGGARLANDDVVPVWPSEGRVVAAAAGGLCHGL